MTRQQTFDALRQRGVTKAVVAFSGGSDEGGPDSITLYAGDNELASLITQPSGHDADAELADALSEPISERFGGFDGDFSVSGELTWEIATGKVTMAKDESEYVYSEQEV